MSGKTFTEIYPDILAGRKVRQTGWPEGEYIHLGPDEYDILKWHDGSRFYIDRGCCGSGDTSWEVLEETVTITASQFDEVWERSLDTVYGCEVVSFDPSAPMYRILKKELGL